MLTQETLNQILSQIAHCGTTVADVIIMAMSPTATRDGPGVVHDVSLRVEDLLKKLHGHQLMCEKVSGWVHATMKAMYTVEILSLTWPDAGLHYIAKGMTENQLRKFNINNIIERMSADAPLVWELLDELLSADPHLRSKQDWARKRAQEAAAAKRRPHKGTSRRNSDSRIDVGTSLDDDEYWEFVDQSVPIVEEDEDEPEDVLDQVKQQHESKIAIVSVVSPCYTQVRAAHTVYV